MLRSTLASLGVLAAILLLCAHAAQYSSNQQTGTLERMLVTSGKVVVALDLSRLTSAQSQQVKNTDLHFEIGANSFFTIRVLNQHLRGPEMGTMALIPRNVSDLPKSLGLSLNQLVIERVAPGGQFDLTLRDSQNGFAFFDVEGQTYDYDASSHLFHIKDGRLLISADLAKKLGHRDAVGATVGSISIDTAVTPIAVTTLVNGAIKSSILPPGNGRTPGAPSYVPGPDIIVGDLTAMVQSGSSGTQVGLGIGTTSCNNGDQPVHFFAIPNTDHSVVSQNLYRMSGGTDNTDRFEEVGESWVKHTFGADQFDDCNLGCTPWPDGTELGVGCSDPYSASENATYSLLGSRAWVNPFTGVFSSNARNHSGHVHTGTSHRVLVAINDLNTNLNTGATYWAEAEYDTPQEYAWCQTHPGQCNMYNNASFRRFNVTGTTNFTFTAVGTTTRGKAATEAWTGSTKVLVEPEPGVDGRAFVVYKVTNPSSGVWHYEYAVHNQNLDRSIQSFSVPLGCGVTISNAGFHAPPNHPGFANDGTLNNAGFSNAPWTANQTSDAISWNCSTFAQDQNANALRFGTLYNFRFDSNKPPSTANATLGFFKTGSPITVQVQGPMADPCNPLQLTSVVSRKTHGAAGDFDVDLPLSGNTGVECRSTSGNHTLVFTFTNQVVSGDAAVTSGTGTVVGSPTFSGNTMTVNLTGVSDVQQITVTASNVMDTFGQTLPDTPVSAVILAGDTNSNRTVNAADVAQTKAQQGATVDQTNFRNDLNANGTINAADAALVKTNAGNSVP